MVLASFDKDIRLAAADAGGAAAKPGAFTATVAKCRADAMDAFAAAYTKHVRIAGVAASWAGAPSASLASINSAGLQGRARIVRGTTALVLPSSPLSI